MTTIPPSGAQQRGVVRFGTTQALVSSSPHTAHRCGPAMDAHLALKRYWGFDQFRLQQEEVIAAVLAGRDALVIMATGSGKSVWHVRYASFQRIVARELMQGPPAHLATKFRR